MRAAGCCLPFPLTLKVFWHLHKSPPTKVFRTLNHTGGAHTMGHWIIFVFSLLATQRKRYLFIHFSAPSAQKNLKPTAVGNICCCPRCYATVRCSFSVDRPRAQFRDSTRRLSIFPPYYFYFYSAPPEITLNGAARAKDASPFWRLSLKALV